MGRVAWGEGGSRMGEGGADGGEEEGRGEEGMRERGRERELGSAGGKEGRPPFLRRPFRHTRDLSHTTHRRRGDRRDEGKHATEGEQAHGCTTPPPRPTPPPLAHALAGPGHPPASFPTQRQSAQPVLPPPSFPSHPSPPAGTHGPFAAAFIQPHIQVSYPPPPLYSRISKSLIRIFESLIPRPAPPGAPGLSRSSRSPPEGSGLGRFRPGPDPRTGPAC